jgi:hypothetical protein
MTILINNRRDNSAKFQLNAAHKSIGVPSSVLQSAWQATRAEMEEVLQHWITHGALREEATTDADGNTKTVHYVLLAADEAIYAPESTGNDNKAASSLSLSPTAGSYVITTGNCH